MLELKHRVGAGTFVWTRHRSRFEVTGNGLSSLLARSTWDFLSAPHGRQVRDALAPVTWTDTTYCAFPRCPTAVASDATPFCSFHEAVWRRAHDDAAPTASPATTCSCGDMFTPPPSSLPRGHRGSLCDTCLTRMNRLHARLRNVLVGIPSAEWTRRVICAVRDIPLPDFPDLLTTEPATHSRAKKREKGMGQWT